MMFSFETRSRADLPFRLVSLRGRYEMSHFTHVGTDGRHGTVAAGRPARLNPRRSPSLAGALSAITLSFALDTNQHEHVHIGLTQRHCLGDSLPS